MTIAARTDIADRPAPARPKRLLVFGFDSAEPAQIRRIRAFLDCGFELRAATMRRGSTDEGPEIFWDNIHLGRTRHEAIGRRLLVMAAALVQIALRRRSLSGFDVIVARNLDMLALAVAARALCRERPPVIYECLDIHGVMTADGRKGRLFRAAERALLRRCAGLIVSSPAFVERHFAPVQGWDGPVALLENKLWLGPASARRPDPATAAARAPGAPVVLGWIGSLRCTRSLDVLARTAAALGDRVEVRMHGIVHRHALPGFDATLAAHPNMGYHGPYDYPGGLAEIYAGCDVVWSQDLWQWGSNSSWLLPNRIYEAGYFGCPSIAVASTETGRRVARGLGWTVPAPESADLCALLETLDHEALAAKRRELLSLPETTFRQTCAEIRAAVLQPGVPEARAGAPTVTSP